MMPVPSEPFLAFSRCLVMLQKQENRSWLGFYLITPFASNLNESLLVEESDVDVSSS